MSKRWAISGTSSFLLAVFLGAWWVHGYYASSADRLLLLLPDGTSFSDPRVTVWLDAASEEGLHVVPVHDSAFVRPLFPESKCAGVILPDSVHQQASDAFLSSLRRFVARGGKLMLVYDAATLSLQGRYATDHARLSDMAGINYALYDALRDQTILWSTVAGAREVVEQMDIPPGKYYPFGSPTSDSSKAATETAPASHSEAQLRRYQYGDLAYPSFITSGNYSGHLILHSHAGIVAGEHTYEKGSVLFVNAPLGYLKGNTDGLLLHVFLNYFAEHVLSLPSLMPVPDGVGGLVLNWHVDSNAAIKPLLELGSWGLLQQGPYSIHITAGPDTAVFGDQKGFDVDHKPISQQLIRQYLSLGHQIGSHGGWMHDYFSAHVDQDNPKDLERLLEWNQRALEQVSRQPVVEYSAPGGNQPAWVTRWLQAHRFLGYYFTGDTGMGPTEGYRDGTRESQNIWAFPVVHLDRAAAFEEMSAYGYSNSQVEQWLAALTAFTADHHVARLIYFHPPGILEYRDAVAQWMNQTARLRTDGRFRWYTMTDLATFLNARKKVSWRTVDQGGTITISAAQPETLEHQTWRLPRSRFSEPVVLRGSARVTWDNAAWIVAAGRGKELQFQSKVVSK